jgi:hypothetical protein
MNHGHAVVCLDDRVAFDPSGSETEFLGGVPQLNDRYLALLVRKMPVPVLPGPLDLEPLQRHSKIAVAWSGTGGA